MAASAAPRGVAACPPRQMARAKTMFPSRDRAPIGCPPPDSRHVSLSQPPAATSYQCFISLHYPVLDVQDVLLAAALLLVCVRDAARIASPKA